MKNMMFAVVVALCVSESQAVDSLYMQATIGLSHQLTFSVPGLSEPIEQVKFHDIDGDGFPEVLACDGPNLVLYSITKDSILLEAYTGWDTIQTGKTNYLIELGDVNRDSVADVLYGRYLGPMFVPTDSIEACLVRMYDGASGYTEMVAQSYKSGGYWMGSGPNSGISALQALDINDDGFDECIVAFDSTTYFGKSREDMREGTRGSTHIYYSFPDSILRVLGAPVTDIDARFHVNNTNLFLTSVWSYYNYDMPGVDGEATSLKPATLDQNGTLNMVSLLAKSDGPVRDYTTEESIWRNKCVGNLTGDSVSVQLLLERSWLQDVWDYDPDSGHYVQTHYSAGTEGRMVRLISQDEAELIWADTGTIRGKCQYDPTWPGYFYELRDGALKQVRGEDGSLFQYTSDLPQGNLQWETPFKEDEIRLVAILNSQISFYRLDVTVGVVDGPSAVSLPTTFVLGQPYPNPFNAELSIPITLERKSYVKTEIFNLLGEQVLLIQNGLLPGGRNVLHWDAGGVASGVYLIRASVEGSTATAKVVLLK